MPHPLSTDQIDRAEVKLADFGVATRWTSGQPEDTFQVGKDRFWAPELEKEDHGHTPATDVFALGLALRTLLTGAHTAVIPVIASEEPPPSALRYMDLTPIVPATHTDNHPSSPLLKWEPWRRIPPQFAPIIARAEAEDP